MTDEPKGYTFKVPEAFKNAAVKQIGLGVAMAGAGDAIRGAIAEEEARVLAEIAPPAEMALDGPPTIEQLAKILDMVGIAPNTARSKDRFDEQRLAAAAAKRAMRAGKRAVHRAAP